MLPMFPHSDTERAREIYQHINFAADGTPRDKTVVEHYAGQPFKVLLAALLSARTLEEDTGTAVERLFALADTPAKMRTLTPEAVLEAIQTVTYPETKVQYVLETAAMLDDRGGEVPRTVPELMAFPGVGWKSAVLTLWLAYGLDPEICVDVHVGRIGKRLGMVNVKTNDPPKISRELMAIVPRELWGRWNPAMVMFGRNVCYPTRPACSRCPVNELCPKIGVAAKK